MVIDSVISKIKRHEPLDGPGICTRKLYGLCRPRSAARQNQSPVDEVGGVPRKRGGATWRISSLPS